MSDKIDINKFASNKNPELAQQALNAYYQTQNDSLNLGVLGKIFGKKDYAVHNIIGLVLIFFVLTLVIYLFAGPETQTLSRKDVLTILLPTITTIIGFLVGKHKSE